VPTINPVQSAEVRAAISRAATRTGVDFDYLLAQAKLESGLDPNAKAKTSTATGLFQFIESTWLRTLDQHSAKHGMDWAGMAIDANGRVADAATRDQLLSLRHDADTASLMAAELARDNGDGLRVTLGRDAEPVELYLAHFLGLGGARKFLGALASDPNQSAAALMPKAAKANRAIFYDGGSARSVGDVMALMRSKVDAAYGSTSASFGHHGIQGELQGAPASAPPPATPTWQPRRNLAPPPLPAAGGTRPSMADTLRATFGSGAASPAGANEHIAAAYSKFKAFGL